MDILKKACFIVVFLAISNSLAFAQTVIEALKFPGIVCVFVNEESNEVYVGSNQIEIDSNGSFVLIKGFIDVLDGDTHESISQITFEDKGLVDIVVNSETNTIYALVVENLTNNQPLNNFMFVIDGNTKENIAVIDLDNANGEIAVNSELNKIYILGTDNSSQNQLFLQIIDGNVNEIEEIVDLGSGFSFYFNVDSSTNRIYVVKNAIKKRLIKETLESFIIVIDGETNLVVDSIKINNPNAEFTINSISNRLYVTDLNAAGSSIVDVIDTKTNEIIDVIDLELNFGRQIALNELTNKIYVAGVLQDRRRKNIAKMMGIIDGAINEFVVSLQIGDKAASSENIIPVCITVNPNNNQIYYSDLVGNVIIVEDNVEIEL